MGRIGFLGVALAAAVGLWRGEAEACSPPTQFGPYDLAPSDGQTNVPTNVRARILYQQAEVSLLALRDVIIRPVGGQPVSAHVTEASNDSWPFALAVYVKPDAPLLPSTMYELASKVKQACDVDCISTDYVVVATFQTGAGADAQAPSFAGATGFQQLSVVCTDGGCCGPYTGLRFPISYTPSPDSDIVEVRVYREGALVSVTGNVGFHLCSGSLEGSPMASFVNQGGSYTMHAVDLAGNEDTNGASVDVELDCAATVQSDGGTSDAPTAHVDAPASQPDAGLVNNDAPIDHPETSSNGCAVGGGPTLLGVLPALWLFCRRRKSPPA